MSYTIRHRAARHALGVFEASPGGLMVLLEGPIAPGSGSPAYPVFIVFFIIFLVSKNEPNDSPKGPSWAPCWVIFGVMLPNFSELFRCLCWILT